MNVDPAAGPRLALRILPGSYAICRLLPDAPAPAPGAISGLYSVTRTPEEVSVVCPEAFAPAGCRCEPGWRCLRVVGALDMALVGILARLTAPLAAAGVPVFALSTFDTDYLLVPGSRLEVGALALREAGFDVKE